MWSWDDGGGWWRRAPFDVPPEPTSAESGQDSSMDRADVGCGTSWSHEQHHAGRIDVEGSNDGGRCD